MATFFYRTYVGASGENVSPPTTAGRKIGVLRCAHQELEAMVRHRTTSSRRGAPLPGPRRAPRWAVGGPPEGCRSLPGGLPEVVLSKYMRIY